MDAEHDRLLEIAGAVLDGTRLDWDDLGSSMSDSVRSLLHQLRVVSAVASVARQTGPTPAHPAPSTWGALTIVGTLGHGAFGTVYRAWDSRLDREVALKLLDRDDHMTDSAIEEGRLLARVTHPNVVTIYGADRIEGRTGLWMEIIRGETLEQLVARDGPLPVDKAVEVARQLCAAVEAVHATGLLHRDIKTHNVMLADSGRVVLMDFGASHAELEASAIAGTPLYLAPEVFRGGPANVRSDIYAVGVVLYRLLSGTYPIGGATYEEVRAAHQARLSAGTTPPPLRGVHRQVAATVARALRADPAERFSSAAELAEGLAIPRRRARVVATGAAAVLVVAGATAAVSLSHAGGSGPPRTNRAQAREFAGGVESPRSQRFAPPADAALMLAGVSSDGRYYSYTTAEGAVRQLTVADGSTRTLVESDGDHIAEETVTSPDGSQVAYDWWNERNAYEIRVVSRDTRAVRVLLRDDALDVVSPIEWSRDGRTLLVAERLKQGARRIVLVDTDTARSQTVREFEAGAPIHATISPDSAFVAYDMPADPDSSRRVLHVVRAEGSDDHPLFTARDVSDWSPLWTADGHGILFLSDRSGAPDGWLARVDNGVARGDPQVVVRNLSRVVPLALTASGRFYYRVQTGAFDIFEIDPSGATTSATAPRRLGGRFRGANIGPSYAPDGKRIAYVLARDGYGPDQDHALMIRELSTGQERELRPFAGLGFAPPRWSVDNRTLLVRGPMPGIGAGIHAVDSVTGRVIHLVASANERDATDLGPMGWDTTPDGAVYEDPHRGLVRHSVATGAETVIYPYRPGQSHGRIHRFGYASAPGGRIRLGFSARRDNGTDLVLVENGIARTLVSRDFPSLVVYQGWSVDGEWLYYSVVVNNEGAPHQLWRIHASGGPPERLPFDIPGATQINPMSVNPVTGALAYTGGTPTTEIWTMDGFLPTP